LGFGEAVVGRKVVVEGNVLTLLAIRIWTEGGSLNEDLVLQLIVRTNMTSPHFS